VKALCGLPGGGVPATYLSSQQTAADTAAVHRELGKQRPSCKLLYVTPVRTATRPAGPRETGQWTCSEMQHDARGLGSRRECSGRIAAPACSCGQFKVLLTRPCNVPLSWVVMVISPLLFHSATESVLRGWPQEQLAKSEKLVEALRGLRERGLLPRFVIDEVRSLQKHTFRFLSQHKRRRLFMLSTFLAVGRASVQGSGPSRLPEHPAAWRVSSPLCAQSSAAHAPPGTRCTSICCCEAVQTLDSPPV